MRLVPAQRPVEPGNRCSQTPATSMLDALEWLPAERARRVSRRHFTEHEEEDGDDCPQDRSARSPGNKRLATRKCGLKDSYKRLGVTRQCRCRLTLSSHCPAISMVRVHLQLPAPGQQTGSTSAQSYDGER
jgi:hypothetical protein